MNIKTSLATLIILGSISTSLKADPIKASVEGCVNNIDTPINWTQESQNGFIFMAFWNQTAGCISGISNPTNGFHIAEMFDDRIYKISVLPNLLSQINCGSIQFDAQSYNSTGLDTSGLKSLVYNTGKDCSSAIKIVNDTPKEVEQVPEIDSFSLITLGIGLMFFLKLIK